MLMEPGEIHTTDRVVGAANYFVTRIPQTTLLQMAREIKPCSAPHLSTPCLDDPFIFHAFTRFQESVQENAPRLEAESRLAYCVDILLRRHVETPLSSNKPSASSYRLGLARDFIHENLGEDVSLQTLSSLSGLSRFHFLRAFREKFGLPPHAYQLRVRITKAMGLISRGHFNTMDLGFSDQSHFIRQFKKVVGLAPGRYAALLRQSPWAVT